MKHDLILYDLDGTIWDSVPVIMMTFKYAYEQVLGKCERTDEDLMSYIGKPLETTFSMHDEKTARALLEAYLEYNHKLLAEDAVPLFPGVYDDLKMLKETGVMQGVVTSKRKDSAMLTLELKGLESFFDVYVYKDDTAKHKPDPDPLIYAAGRLGITDMSRVIYVGDAMPDALCARNAGADFALVSWSKMDKEQIVREVPKTGVIGALADLD